jgi:hypothetical protein
VRVVVEILPEARQDLLNLLAARTRTDEDAIRFGYTYLEDMDQQFTKYQGLPPGARRRRWPDGTDWWWRYVNGVWVECRVVRA